MAFYARPRLAAGATDFLLLPAPSLKIAPELEKDQVSRRILANMGLTSYHL